MPIITISRGSYSKGKEIAEKLAQKLGFECISRDILIEASEYFNIPEVKLVRAIHDAPSVLDRFTYGKEKYIAFIREALLARVQKDNVIYHGLAGHFFLERLPNVLKVRIIANMEDRVTEEMHREKVSEERARYLLQKDDEERRKWSMYLYGIDTWDPRLYDVVLHVNQLNIDDAVDILVHTAKRPCFRTTPESKVLLENMLLAAKARRALINEFPAADISSRDGVLFVNVEAPLSQQNHIITKVDQLLKNIDGVQAIQTHIIPLITTD
ncbi:MAG: cytidylate kinase-like family protein [Proteobacteria bacterium]|nr:cytidylate kinase-like family protein [Pseudomonadota bacterium]